MFPTGGTQEMGTLAAPAARYLIERRGRQEIARHTAIDVSYVLRSLDMSFGDRPLKSFGTRAIERWSEAHPHWKPSTRASNLSVVRAFCRWLQRRKLIKGDPFADIVPPRRPRPNPQPLTRDDVARLLRHAPDARGRLIVWLQFGLGLRCIGCANLRIEDIDFSTRTLCLIEKGGVQRRLPLTPEVHAELDRYLFQFPATSGPLLRSIRNGYAPISAAHIGGMVARWMVAAGVKRGAYDGVSAHALRRTALTELAEATGDAFIVQELAGWASPHTAAHYVRRATTERVRNALEMRGDLL